MESETILGIIGAVIAILLATYFTLHYEANAAALQALQNTSLSGGKINSTINSSIFLNSVEVSRHNSPQDCWLIIENKVYDLTNFLNLHTGGASQIIPSCGTDATQVFLTKDNTGTHAAGDLNFLNPFYLGDVNSQISSPTVSNTTQPPITVPRRRGENGD